MLQNLLIFHSQNVNNFHYIQKIIGADFSAWISLLFGECRRFCFLKLPNCSESFVIQYEVSLHFLLFLVGTEINSLVGFRIPVDEYVDRALISHLNFQTSNFLAKIEWRNFHSPLSRIE